MRSMKPDFLEKRTLPITDLVTTEILKAETRPIKIGALTNGLISTSDTFTFIPLSDTVLRIAPIASAYFESQIDNNPFRAFAQVDVPLNTLGLVADGLFVHYVVIASDGTISGSSTRVVDDPDKITLGIVYLKKTGSVVEFINGAAGPLNVFPTPMLSDVSAYDRAAHAFGVDLTFNPNANLTLRNLAGSVTGESINWAGVGNKHVHSIPANDPTQFRLVHAGLGSLPAPPGLSTALDPTQYWNGSALVALSTPNKASVQRIFVTVIGTITIQYGEFEYADLTEAVANIQVAPFTELFPAGYYAEIARVAMKKSTTNLQNTGDAVFALREGAISTAGEITTASNLGSGNGIFAQKVGSDLQFKSLIAGTNITITTNATGITIAATGSIGVTVEWVDVLNKPAAITAIMDLVPVADRIAYYTGSSTAALTVLTSFTRTLLDDPDAATWRATLGLGTAAVANLTTSQYDYTTGRATKVGDYGLGASSASILANCQDVTLRGGFFFFDSTSTNRPTGMDFGVIINVATADTAFHRIAISRSPTAGMLAVCTRASSVTSSWIPITTENSLVVSAFMKTLLDDPDAATARSTLGLGTAATATLTTSTFDGTIGRVSRVGDFSLGGPAIGIGEAAISSEQPTAIYNVIQAALGVLPINQNGYLDHVDNASAGFARQEYSSVAENRKFMRTQIAGTYSGWVEYWTTGNLPITTYAKTLLDDADAATARTTLGLGTGATSTVTTSQIDTSSGRLLKVGDFGLGGNGVTIAPPIISSDLNSPSGSGFYNTNTSTNSPEGSNGWLLHQDLFNPNYDLQEYSPINSLRSYKRIKSAGTYTSWHEYLIKDAVNTMLGGPLYIASDSSGTTIPFALRGSAAAGVGLIGFNNSANTVQFGYVGSSNSSGSIVLNSTSEHVYIQAGGTTKLQTTAAGITVTGTVTATSDKKYKKNIKKVKDSISRIMSLKVRSFFFELLDRDQIGFIAQEVKNVYPNSVWRQKEEGRKSSLVMTKDEIIADLVAVVQTQQKDIEDLKKKVNDLTK